MKWVRASDAGAAKFSHVQAKSAELGERTTDARIVYARLPFFFPFKKLSRNSSFITQLIVRNQIVRLGMECFVFSKQF
jgi:hypothetical protein